MSDTRTWPVLMQICHGCVQHPKGIQNGADSVRYVVAESFGHDLIHILRRTHMIGVHRDHMFPTRSGGGQGPLQELVGSTSCLSLFVCRSASSTQGRAPRTSRSCEHVYPVIAPRPVRQTDTVDTTAHGMGQELTLRRRWVQRPRSLRIRKVFCC
jgi:hypothetical protein